MLPVTLALVDDDDLFAELLGEYLRGKGIDVHRYADSIDLLGDPAGYGYDFYLMDLSLPGVDGLETIKVLRRRSKAGVVVVSGRVGADVFEQVVEAGADMYLCKPVQFSQVLLTIQAVHRRARPSEPTSRAWQLDRRAKDLVAPDGARIALSEADLIMLECFVVAKGEPVPRETLVQQLGKIPSTESGDGLNATIYRLRRRIERATPALAPLETKARVGYLFKAPLVAS